MATNEDTDRLAIKISFQLLDDVILLYLEMLLHFYVKNTSYSNLTEVAISILCKNTN